MKPFVLAAISTIAIRLPNANCFRLPQQSHTHLQRKFYSKLQTTLREHDIACEGDDWENRSTSVKDGSIKFLTTNVDVKSCISSIGTLCVALGVNPNIAHAAGPDWGIFEGRTGSLLHPAMMGTMFLFSLYTALLGFQWRRQRTIGSEITELKKSLPAFEGETLGKAISQLKASENPDVHLISLLEKALPIEQQIEELTLERKDLTAAGPKDKHFNNGALLAFIGTAFAIEGPLNTYARAGKLFPGPHLYAGAGLVVLWSLAAACVPSMQKGNDTARSIHIGANAAGIGLFGWQVVSGWPILLKVIEKTSWP